MSSTVLKIVAGAVVAVSAIASPAMAQQSELWAKRRMDSRCPSTFDYTTLCPSVALELGKISTTTSADPTSCDKLGQCETCLTGDEWKDRLATELGLGVADRTGIRPWVLFRNWLSHEVTSTLAMILLREALGYDAYGKTGSNTGNIDLICCGAEEFMVDFERWGEGGSAVRLSEEGYFTVQMVPTGYVGTGAFYMPSYTLSKYPLADAYNAYKYLPEYSSIFPPALSTNCSDMLRVKDDAGRARCAAGTATPSDFVCSTNTWTNTTCSQGRYIPPQCMGDNAQYCQEIYHPTPGTDRGRFEGIIKNNKLNFTIVYVGNTGFGDYIKARARRGEDFLYVGQVPDPLAAAVSARAINFDPNTAACEAVRNSDPTLNMAGCAYPTTTIQKAARRDVLRQHPDFKFFVENFQISDSLIAELLVAHKEGTGNKTVHQVVCSWLKNNYNVWSKWIQNTPVDDRTFNAKKDDGVEAYVIAIPVVVGFLVIAGLIVAAIFLTRKTVDNTFAPKTAPLALLFTDVERSTTLWELCGDDMKQAMDTHNAVIRKLIAEYQAYEVKTNGDSFMIACRSLTDATLLAAAIQSGLNEAEYPPSISETYSHILAHPKGAVLPPRVPNGQAAMAGAGAQSRRSASRSSHTSSAIPVSAGVRSVSHKYQASVALSGAPHTQTSPSHNGASASRHSSAPATTTVDCWNGIRVRIALHWATESTPKVDPMTGRYDYFGHDINVCARVEGYACGGQILVEESTHAHMLANDDLMDLLSTDCTVTCVAKAAVLKGVADKVALWSILPLALRGRKFKPIPGANGTTNGGGSIASASDGMVTINGTKRPKLSTNGGDAETGSLDSHSAATAGPQPSADATSAAAVHFSIRFALGGFTADGDRNKWLQTLAAKYKLPSHFNAGRLTRVVQTTAANMFLAQHGSQQNNNSSSHTTGNVVKGKDSSHDYDAVKLLVDDADRY